MTEHEDRLSQEALDSQTAGLSAELSPRESRLIQEMHTLAQRYAHENERSLEQIWNKFTRYQEQQLLQQDRQQEESRGRLLFKEEKVMQIKNPWSETPTPSYPSLPEKGSRRPLWRVLSISAAVAVVVSALLSWVYVTYSIHHTTATPASSQKPGTFAGTLACSFDDQHVSSTAYGGLRPTLQWSSQGAIAETYDYLETISAQNCALISAKLSSADIRQATWSSDGKQLLVVGLNIPPGGLNQWQVIDATTGQVLSRHTNGSDVRQAVWSPDSTQIIAVVYDVFNPQTMRVQIVNASTGALIRNALSFSGTTLQDPDDSHLAESPAAPRNIFSLSPGGKYFAAQMSNNTVQIWDVATGKQVSTIPLTQPYANALAWSPGGSLLAINPPHSHEVQVWSTATGQLQASYKDSDSTVTEVKGLAWSPDGKYLASGSSAMHIWNVQTKQLIATFGKLDSSHEVAALAWSPDGKMLASVTVHRADEPDDQSSIFAQHPLNVWKLA